MKQSATFSRAEISVYDTPNRASAQFSGEAERDRFISTTVAPLREMYPDVTRIDVTRRVETTEWDD